MAISISTAQIVTEAHNGIETDVVSPVFDFGTWDAEITEVSPDLEDELVRVANPDYIADAGLILSNEEAVEVFEATGLDLTARPQILDFTSAVEAWKETLPAGTGYSTLEANLDALYRIAANGRSVGATMMVAG